MLPRAFSFVAVLLTPLLGFSNQPTPARFDSNGFPLPQGALARLGDLRFATAGSIAALALSSDGKTLVTATVQRISEQVKPDDPKQHEGRSRIDERLVFWNADTGHIVREETSPTFVNELAISANGLFLAVGTMNGIVQVWNMKNGKCLWSSDDAKQTTKKAITALCFLNDGRLLAVRHAGCQVQIWDVEKGTQLRFWETNRQKEQELASLGPGYKFLSAALSPSGQKMAWLAVHESDSKDKLCAVFLYDTLTGKLVRSIKGIRLSASGIHLPDEGQTLLVETQSPLGGLNVAISGKDGRMIFEIPSRVPNWFGRNAGVPIPPAWMVQVAIDRKSVFMQDKEGMIRWDLATGKRLAEWPDGCEALAFSADGKRAAMARGNRCYILNENLSPVGSNNSFSIGPSVRFQANGQLLASEWSGGRCIFWDARNGRALEIKHRKPEPSIGRNPRGYDSRHFRMAYVLPKAIHVHDLLTDRQICTLASFANEDVWNVGIALSPDGKLVLVSEPEKDVILVRWFDSQIGKELGRYVIPSKEVFPSTGYLRPVQWHSTDGSVFGYVSPNNCLTLVNCQSRKAFLTVGIPVPPPESPNGGSGWPSWQYETLGQQGLVLASRNTPNVAHRREFALWDRSGVMVRHLDLKLSIDHEGWHSEVSPDGRFLAVRPWGSNELVLYETATCSKRGSLRAPNAIRSSSFAPDGKTLATSCEDTSILIWDINRPLDDQAVFSAPRTAEAQEQIWRLLNDPRKGEQAIWTLVRAPQMALSLLRQRLQPVRAPDAAYLGALIAQLDSPVFKDREAAERDLVALKELALPALREALQRATLEQSRRLEKLIRNQQQPGSNAYAREFRAIEILERIGSKEACDLLRVLANGAQQSPQTSEAGLALERLERNRWRNE